MTTKELVIAGMCCNHCIKSIQDVLDKTEGIHSAKVSMEQPQAIVELSKEIPFAELKQIIARSGHYELIEEVIR